MLECFMMDYIKKILGYLKKRQEHDGLISFEHETDYAEQRVITVHTNDDGMVVMTVFTLEEFEMLKNIVELTGSDPYDIIVDLVKENNITTIVFDPKEF